MSKGHLSEFRLSIYLALLGAWLIYYSWKKIKQKTSMKIMAKQVISAASAGSVEIEAVAWPLRAIDTCLSGNKVVYRFIRLQKLVNSRRNKTWETVWSKSSPEPFLIFDPSGFAIINPYSNTNALSMSDGLTEKEYPTHKLTSSQLESFDGLYDNSVSGFRASIGGSFLSSFFTSSYRILERTIPIGTPLLIHGYLSPEDHFRYVHLKEEYILFKQRADKLIGNKNYRLSLLDKDKDGTVDAKELYNGFLAALKNSVKKDFSITDFKQTGLPQEKIYGTINDHSNQELTLIDCFEEQLLNSKPIYLNWLCLYLGAGLIALAVFILMYL